MKEIKSIFKHMISLFSLLIWFLRQIKNENFRNYINKSQRCKILNILGNGPSLNKIINNKQFYKNRKNEEFCVVNYCALSPLFKLLKPEHYVLADPLFFDRPSRSTKVQPLINELLNIDWNLNLYIPFKYYPLIKKELSSNFCTYKNHAKELLKYLQERFDHAESGYIYEKLYEFFDLINNEKNIKII